MGELVIAIFLMSLSVGICVLALQIGSRPDSSFWELVHPPPCGEGWGGVSRRDK